MILIQSMLRLAAMSYLPTMHAFAYGDLLDLFFFMGPASSASSGMTALALNAGSKKAAEWFYLPDTFKSQAARSIKHFEDKSRISLAQNKPPFFCSTILYLQGAALAVQKLADVSIAQTSPFEKSSTSSTVASLLASYPAAIAYSGYCVQLFPSPTWKQADAPCEGMEHFPKEEVVAGVALFSLKCLAASDFDWREISPGYRPGGVSALLHGYAPVVPFSAAPVCSQKRNSDMANRIVGMVVQSLFTQLFVGPVSAMLTMEVKEICSNSFEGNSCLRFENVMDTFFESWNAAKQMASSMTVDAQCLFLRADFDATSHLMSQW